MKETHVHNVGMKFNRHAKLSALLVWTFGFNTLSTIKGYFLWLNYVGNLHVIVIKKLSGNICFQLLFTHSDRIGVLCFRERQVNFNNN